MYDDFQVVTQGDSFLMGITYYGKDDVVEEDWAELNLYLGFVRLTWRKF